LITLSRAYGGPGDVRRQLGLLIEAQAAAEVEEQPLDVEFGQLKGRLEAEADRHGSKAG
jgi:hypothetical protein